MVGPASASVGAVPSENFGPYWSDGVTCNVRILVLFYTVNFTTYSSKVDYTILTLVPRQDTTL